MPYDPRNPTHDFSAVGVPDAKGGFQYPSSGPNNTMEYMASGLPFVTASVATATPFRIDFPYVTSEIYIQLSGSTTSTARLGFTEQGVNGSNYFVVDSVQGATAFRIRCKTIYIRTNTGTAPSYSVMAALTTIPNKSFPTLTGSAADPITGRAMFNSASNEPIFGYRGL